MVLLAASRIVFRHQEAEALRELLVEQAKGVRADGEALRSQVAFEVYQWDEESASRQSQLGAQVRVDERIEELAGFLDDAANAVGMVSEAAYDVEVRNVALLD